MLCTGQEVYEYLANLETGKFMGGCDGISPKMLKSTAEKFNSAAPLAMLFISTGNYPLAGKKARVVPVTKSGDPSLVNNYRLVQPKWVNVYPSTIGLKKTSLYSLGIFSIIID